MIPWLALSLVLAGDPVATPLVGIVKQAGDFGIDLEVNGKPGRVVREDFSWRADERISELVKPGELLAVQPLRRADLDGVQLYSHRLATPDPWPKIHARYKPRSLARATVVKLLARGLLLRLDDEVQAVLEAPKRKPRAGEIIDVLVRFEPRDGTEALLLEEAPAKLSAPAAKRP